MNDSPTTEAIQTEPTQAPPTIEASDLVRERFAAVAARAGLEPDYEDVLHGQALAWCKAQSVEPTREQLSRFVTEQKAQRPKLFGGAIAGPANTAPAPAGARSAPTPSVATPQNPYTQWRSLVDGGRKAEAEAFYRMNRRAIARHS